MGAGMDLVAKDGGLVGCVVANNIEYGNTWSGWVWVWVWAEREVVGGRSDGRRCDAAVVMVRWEGA